MYAVTVPVPEVTLMDRAWCGTVIEPLDDAERAENPVGTAQTDGVMTDGSSMEISMLKVAVPVTTMTRPTLNGFWKLSEAMTALRPVPVFEIVTGVILLSYEIEGPLSPSFYLTLAAAADINGIP
jgi:hypothetical protein